MFHKGGYARKNSIFQLKSIAKCSLSSMGESQVWREHHQSTTNPESICSHLNCKYIFTECFHPHLGDRIYIYWKAIFIYFFIKSDLKKWLLDIFALSLAMWYDQGNKQCEWNLDAQTAVSDSSHHAIKDSFHLICNDIAADMFLNCFYFLPF